MKQSTYERHLTAVKAGVVTKTNITGIKKLINAAERRNAGYSVSRTAPQATVTETLALRRLISEYQPAVAVDLHNSGLKVLRNPRYAKRWNERERAIINYPLLRFRLVGFDIVGNGNAVPVYKAIGDDRMGSFCFRNIPWQTAYYSGEETGPVIMRDYK